MILILGNAFLNLVSVLINFALNVEGIKAKSQRKYYVQNAMNITKHTIKFIQG